MAFENDPKTEFIGSVVRLLEPLVYVAHDGARIVVPAGFECDLDSRPGWLPGFIRMWMASAIKAAAPAILHDYLYRNGGYYESDGFKHIGKMRADQLFREALEDEEDTAVSRWLFWGGVFAGGAKAWYTHRWNERYGDS